MIQQKVYSEYQDKGFKMNAFTVDDLQDMMDMIMESGASELESNKIIILGIRYSASQGSNSTTGLKKTIDMWIKFGLTTSEQVGDFVKKQEAGEDVKKPTWTTGKITVPTEEERREAKAYLAEMNEQGIVKA